MGSAWHYGLLCFMLRIEELYLLLGILGCLCLDGFVGLWVCADCAVRLGVVGYCLLVWCFVFTYVICYLVRMGTCCLYLGVLLHCGCFVAWSCLWV